MKWNIRISVWNENTKRYLDINDRRNGKYFAYANMTKDGWIIKGEKKIKMSFGEIDISKKKSKCARCLGNIPKHRKRIKIYGSFNKHTTAQYFHLDCYKVIMKGFLKDIRDNLKKIRVSKKYIEEKNKDLVLEMI